MSAHKGKGITEADRRAMVQGMLALHQEIGVEINKPSVDPTRLLRLLGAGMNQCLIAQAAFLSPEALTAERAICEEVEDRFELDS